MTSQWFPAKSWKAFFHDGRRVRAATMKTM